MYFLLASSSTLILIFTPTELQTCDVPSWTEFTHLAEGNYNYCHRAKITTWQLRPTKKSGSQRLPCIYLFFHVGCLPESDFSKKELQFIY